MQESYRKGKAKFHKVFYKQKREQIGFNQDALFLFLSEEYQPHFLPTVRLYTAKARV